MHTPKDASQTHILVFPTSATAHANQPGKTDTDNDNLDMDFLGEDGVPGLLGLVLFLFSFFPGLAQE